jgi:hypothetical protein
VILSDCSPIACPDQNLLSGLVMIGFATNIWIGQWKSNTVAETQVLEEQRYAGCSPIESCNNQELVWNRPMSLKEQVEALLPNWESWYPSLFHAAEDLGIIRARVCSPSSLLLSHRHAGVQAAALDAHREKWGGRD